MRLFLCVLLILSVAVACSSCGTPSFSAEKAKRMETIVEQAMTGGNIPGVIVGVWTPEGVWVRAFGKSDVNAGTAMDKADRVRIASNTKTFVATVLRHDNYFPPGGGYHYSDTNYEAAGLIIEKVTGNKVEDEVRARIIEPLGLGNTSFPETPDMSGRYAKGYVVKDGKLADYTRVDPSVPWAGGAMISNLYDMKAWAEALAAGKLLDSRMHAQQTKTVKTGTGATEYGLGALELDGFWGHTGAIFGYSSIFMRDPQRDATFVVFANKATNDSSEAPGIALALMKLIYPDPGKK